MIDRLEAPRGRLRRWFRSAWLVPVPVLVLFGIWMVAFYGPGHDPRDAILIGRHFVEQSNRSSVIKIDPNYRYPGNEIGYDGEFFYYIALDPIDARYYIDAPSYRYTRIVYPLLARALALGRPNLVPYALLFVNWLAVGAGTLFAALWLRRRGVSPWFALVYGLFPGLFVAVTRDLSEPLAYALVALGVYLWDADARRRLIWSAIAFAVAVLTRETAVVFPILYAAALLLVPNGLQTSRRRSTWLDAAMVVAISVLPLALWKVFLFAWLGRAGDPGLLLERVPFLGLIVTQDSQGWVEEVRSVVAPALICAGAALVVVWRRLWLLEPWVLLINVLLFVVLLHRSSYVDISASARVTTGVVLAAILCLPLLSRVLASRAWFWSAAVLWLSLVPFWILIPEYHWLLEITRPLRHRL